MRTMTFRNFPRMQMRPLEINGGVPTSSLASALRERDMVLRRATEVLQTAIDPKATQAPKPSPQKKK